ncbi:MAG: hypothetical protein QOJ02_4276 [Acidobacteriota bacterium]|jgi:hypothetical protein|nr:hypothetical protein [Acidobacteriota bacterium]
MDREKGGMLIRSTLHNYAMSSHLIHADESALSLLWDRNHRPEEESEKQAIAHTCRLLSDNLSHLFLIWNALIEAFKLDKTELNNVYREAKSLFQQLELGEEGFWQTQEI